MNNYITKADIFEAIDHEDARIRANKTSNYNNQHHRLMLTRTILEAVDSNLSPLDNELARLGNIEGCRGDKARDFKTYNVGSIVEAVLRHVLGNTKTASKTTKGNDFKHLEIKYSPNANTKSSVVNFANKWDELILVGKHGVYRLSREEAMARVDKRGKLNGSYYYDNLDEDLTARLGY